MVWKKHKDLAVLIVVGEAAVRRLHKAELAAVALDRRQHAQEQRLELEPRPE